MTFLVILLVTSISGVVLLTMWWSSNRSTNDLIAEIKAQMPPNPAVPEEPVAGPTGEGV